MPVLNNVIPMPWVLDWKLIGGSFITFRALKHRDPIPGWLILIALTLTSDVRSVDHDALAVEFAGALVSCTSPVLLIYIDSK